LSWDGAQHLSELAGGEFARSTGAGDHLRQTLGHFLLTQFTLDPPRPLKRSLKREFRSLTEEV
jgi:hypothetical protein